eukprot:TRINITY_DN17678_c0_g1_i1.p1 TRINITY_DN17678_c0_g1~~TRINITY_DN17678_c0_g1_i1.p1  ORF type:complete len:311 (-),score=36.46 TRINITY_DN17678_c0_g1_i1:10-942(-)
MAMIPHTPSLYNILHSYGIPGGGECHHISIDFTRPEFNDNQSVRIPAYNRLSAMWIDGPGVIPDPGVSANGRLDISVYSVFHKKYVGSFLVVDGPSRVVVNYPRCAMIFVFTLMPMFISYGEVALRNPPISLPEDDGITIYVESENDSKIFAHKLILCENSEVFARMLKSEMKETQEKMIILRDTNFTAAEGMIRFLYTQSVSIREIKNLMLLFHLAFQYQIAPLAEVCDARLCNCLNETNFHELAIFAKQYRCHLLSAALAEHIKTNYKGIAHFLPEIAENNPALTLALAKNISEKRMGRSASSLSFQR